MANSQAAELWLRDYLADEHEDEWKADYIARYPIVPCEVRLL